MDFFGQKRTNLSDLADKFVINSNLGCDLGVYNLFVYICLQLSLHDLRSFRRFVFVLGTLEEIAHNLWLKKEISFFCSVNRGCQDFISYSTQ